MNEKNFFLLEENKINLVKFQKVRSSSKKESVEIVNDLCRKNWETEHNGDVQARINR